MAAALLRGLLLTAVLAGATAVNGHPRLGSRHGHVCATTCTDTGSNRYGARNQVPKSHLYPHFQPRVTYRYVYSGEAFTRAEVVNSMESSLYVRTFVDIMADTSCDMKIKIDGLEFPNARPEDTREVKAAFEAHDLHFSFQDGRIDEVCPHPDEDPRALNFKRAILSSLQTTLTRRVFQPGVSYSTRVLETDALGQCRTKYAIEMPRRDGTFIVNKTKEECRGDGVFPYISHTTYNADFDQSHHSPVNFTETEKPFYSQDQHCRMTLQKGVWQNVECHQKVDIKSWDPTSSDRKASVKLQSSLQLHSTVSAEQQEWNFSQDEVRREHRGLQMELEMFDAPDKRRGTTPEEVAMTLSDLLAAMKSNSGLEEDRPHKFTHLVDQLGRLKGKHNFDHLWQEYGKKPLYREFLLDALTLCETEECLGLTSRLAVSEMDPSRVHMWLSGLHFAKKPAVEGISSVMNLTKSVKYRDEALMTASSLVYRLCRQQNKCELTGQSEFRPHRKFLEYVDEVIGDSCGYKEPRRHNNIILVLKALGNSGMSFDGSKLGKCYMNKMLKRDIRAAALMSFRRHQGCSSDDKKLWQLLEDRSEDVAIRIESYKILQKCAYEYEDFFGRIKGLLLDEEVNQVGSYIWTHVRNLAESSSTDRSELSMLAKHHYLIRKFQSNTFKHSRNYHSSFHSDTFNMGGSMSSDVVFTPDSFLPYCANFNLTLNVLHNSFNPIEIGGNFHGFEKYAKRLFGKGSLFEDDRVIGFLQNLKKQKRNIEDSKLEEFQHLYDEAATRAEEADGDEEQDPTIYVRIFGNEVLHFDPRSPSKMLEQLYHLRDSLHKPSSIQLFEQEYVATTILGFPLRMRLNSTASVAMHKEFITVQTEGGDERHVRFTPSASLIWDRSVKVDAYAASSAMRNTITTFSKLEYGGSLSRNQKDGNVFKFDLPNTEIAKISTASKLLFYDSGRRSWDEYYSGRANEMSSCTGRYTRQPLGVELCASAHSGPSGYSSLEPYTAQLVLSKTDTFDHYLIKGDIVDSFGKLQIDTPGSSVSRNYGLQIDFRNWGESEVLLTIGGKLYSLTGGIVAKANDYDFNLKYSDDNRPQIEVKARFKMDDGGKRGLEASAGASLSLFGRTYAIENSLTATSAKMNYSGELTGFSKEPYRIGVFLESDFHQTYAGNAFVTFDKVRLEGRGRFMASEDSFDVELATDYKNVKSRKNLFKVSGSRTIEDETDKWTGELLLETSIFAKIKAEYEVSLSPDELDLTSALLVDGRKMSMHGLWRDVRRNDITDVHLLLETNFEELRLNYRAQVVYKISPNAAHLEAEYKLRDILLMKASAMYAYQKSPLHFQAGLHLQYQEAVLRLFNELDFSQQDGFDVVFEAQIGNSSTGFVVRARYPEGEEWHLDFNTHLRVERRSEFSFYTRRKLSASQEKYSSVNEIVWGNFGETWFEDVAWTENKTEISLKSKHTNLKFVYEKSPLLNVYFALLYPDDDIRFKVDLVQKEPGFAYDFSVYDDHDIFPEVKASVSLNSESFRGSLGLGSKSELVVEGNFTRKNRDDVEAQATVIVRTPSETSYSGHVALNHTYDGRTRDVQVLGTYEGQVTTMHIKILNHDGWFSNDNRGLTFELTTPLESLSSAKFDFLNLAHSEHTDYVELQVNEIKLRGEARLSDWNDMEFTISYDDSADCDRNITFFNKREGDIVKTGGSLNITPSIGPPWAFNFTGSNGLGGYFEDTLQFDLDLTSPLMASPFRISGDYQATRYSFSASGQIGASEVIGFQMSGNSTYTWSDKKFSGEFSLDLPSDKTISFSTDVSTSESTFTIDSEFHSFFTDFEKVVLSGNSSYTDWSRLSWDFHIKLPEHEANSKFNFTFDDNAFVLVLGAMFNNLSAALDSVGTWNPTVPEVSADVTLNFKNGVSHTNQLTFNLHKGEDEYTTALTALSQGEEQIDIICNLQLEDITNWDTNIEIRVPALSSNTFKSQVRLKGDPDNFQGSFSLSPVWEKEFMQSFTFENDGGHWRIETSSSIDSEQLFLLRSRLRHSKSLKDVDAKVDFDVYKLPHIHISWAHEFTSKQYIMAKTEYGNSTANFTYSVLFSEKDDFESFEMVLKVPTGGGTNICIITEGNSDYVGSFEFEWDSYSVVLATDHTDGLTSNLTLISPYTNHTVDIQYSNDNDEYNFVLEVQEVQSPILSVSMNVSSIFPVFDVNIDSNFRGKNINLKSLCDFSQLERNVISLELKLMSDFEDFRAIEVSFRGSLLYRLEDAFDIALNSVGRFSFNGLENELNVNFNVEASEKRDEIKFNTQMFCTAEYFILEKQGIEARLDFKANNHTVFEAEYKDGHHNPSFTLDLNLSHFDFEVKLVTIYGTVYKASLDSEKRNAYLIDISKLPTDGSEPTKASLEIRWVFGKVMQITLKGNSNFGHIATIIGKIKGNPNKQITTSLKLVDRDEETFTTVVKYDPTKDDFSSGALVIRVKNTIGIKFQGSMNMNYVLEDDYFESSMAIATSKSPNIFKYRIHYEYYKNMSILLNNPVFDFEFNLNIIKDPSLSLILNGTGVNLFVDTEIGDWFSTFEGKIALDLDLPNHKNHYIFRTSYDLTKDIKKIESSFRGNEKTFFVTQASGKLNVNGFDLETETEILGVGSLGITASYAKSPTSLNLRLRDPRTGRSLFSLDFSMTSSSLLLKGDFPGNQYFSTKVDYDFGTEAFALDGNSIVYFPELLFEVTADVNFDLGNDKGNVNINLTTSIEGYESSSLVAKYDFISDETKVFSYIISGGHRSSKVNVKIISLADKFEAVIDIEFAIRDYRKLHFRIALEDQDFVVKLITHKQEIILTGSFKLSKDGFTGTANLKTSIPGYDKFSFSLNLGRPGNSNKYHGEVAITVHDEKYELEISHVNHPTWMVLDSKLKILLPQINSIPLGFHIMYDFTEKYLLGLFFSYGDKWLGGKLEYTLDGDFYSHNISLVLDLTYLEEGKLNFSGNFQTKKLKLNKPFIFHISRRQHPTSVFSADLKFESFFESGEIKVITKTLGSSSYKTMSDFAYNLQDDRNVNFTGKHNKYNVEGKILMKGQSNPWSSVAFFITSNIKGYENIDAYWNVEEKDKSYIVDIALDMQNKRKIQFTGSLNHQPDDMKEPWRSSVLEVSFSSPFTLTHVLKAEYHIDSYDFQASYQYGKENFEISVGTTIGETEGSLEISGNLPIPYISIINFEVHYDFKNTYNLKSEGKFESTTFTVMIDLIKNMTQLESEIEVISPLFTNFFGCLEWSMGESEKMFDLRSVYGLEQRFEVAGNFTHSEEFDDSTISFSLVTPFERLASFSLEGMYGLTAPYGIQANYSIEINEEIIHTSADVDYSEGNVNVLWEGYTSFFNNAEGRINGTMQLSQEANSYATEWTVTWRQRPLVEFASTFDGTKVYVSLTYEDEQILIADVDIQLFSAELDVLWRKREIFHFQSTLQDEGDGKQLIIDISGAFIYSISLQVNYKDIYNFEAKLDIDDKKYSLEGSVNLSLEKSDLKLKYESSDNPYEPIKIMIQYDLVDFIDGQMTSVKDILSLDLEWGDSMSSNVKGMRSANQVVIQIEIKTPFPDLPVLIFGTDVELMLSEQVTDISSTLYVEWNERVSTNVSLKMETGTVNLQWDLETPLEDLQKLSLSFFFSPEKIEAALFQNENEWKLLISYELSDQSLNSMIVFTTPVEGYEEIKLDEKFKTDGSSISMTLNLHLESNEILDFTLEAELLKVLVQLNTPWSPLTNIKISASLSTESEEITTLTSVEWEENKYEFSCVVQILGNYPSVEINLTENEVKSTKIIFNMFSKGEETILKLSIESGHEILDNIECEISLGTDLKILQLEDFLTQWDAYAGMRMDFSLPYHNLTLNSKANAKNLGLQLEGDFIVQYPEYTINSSLWYDFTYPYQLRFSLDTPSFLKPLDLSFNASSSEGHVLFTFNDDKFHLIFDTKESGNIKLSLDSRFEGHPVIMMEGNYNATSSESLGSETSSESLGSDVLVSFEMQLYADKETTTPDLECNAKGHYLSNSRQLIIEGRFNETQQVFYEGYAQVSIPYSLEDKIDWKLSFTKDDKMYQFTHRQLITTDSLSYVSSKIETPGWKIALSVKVNLEERNGSITLSFTEHLDVHALFISWKEEASMFEISLNIESLYLSEDVNITLTLDNSVEFMLALTADYGSKNKGKYTFHHDQNSWNQEHELVVESNDFGSLKSKSNLIWFSTYSFESELILPDDKHHVELDVSMSDFTMGLVMNSPAIPGKTLNVTATLDVAEEWDSSSLQLNALHGEKNSSMKGRYAWKDGELKASLVMEQGGKEIAKIDANALFDIHWDIKVNVSCIDPTYDGSSGSLRLKPSWPFALILIAKMPQKIIRLQSSLDITESEIIFHIDKQGVQIGYSFSRNSGFLDVFSHFNKKYEISMDYTLQDIFRSQIKIKTPFIQLRFLKTEINIPLIFERSVWIEKDVFVRIEHMENTYEIFTKIHMKKEPYQIELRVKTPYHDFEHLSLFLEYENSSRKAAFAVLEYPGNKFGFEFEKYFVSLWDFAFVASVHLPVEGFEEIVIRYVVREDLYAFETILGNVSIGTELEISYVTLGQSYELRGRLNDNFFSLKSNLILISFDHVFTDDDLSSFDPSFLKISLSAEFDLGRLSTSHYLDIGYDEYEQVYILWKILQTEMLKVYVAWGEVLGIDMLYRYHPDLKLNARFISSENERDLMFRIGYMPYVYGFQVLDKKMNNGRRLRLSGEIPDRQLGVDGSYAASEAYFENSALVEVDNDQYGYRMIYKYNGGFLEDEYIADAQLMLKKLRPRLKNHLAIRNAKVKFLSEFKLKESQTNPMSLELEYKDNSLFGVGSRNLGITFKHESIKDIIFAAYVTEEIFGKVYGSAHFRDENEESLKYLLDFEWIPKQSSSGISVSHIVLHLPKSNAVFNATTTTLNMLDNKSIEIHINLDIENPELPSQVLFNTTYTKVGDVYDVSTLLGSESGPAYELGIRMNTFNKKEYLHMFGKDHGLNNTWDVRAGARTDLPHAFIDVDIGEEENSTYESRTLKIGLVDPTNIGIFMDHWLFGHQRRDFQASLSLESPDLLRVSSTFDPALRFMESDIGMFMHFVSPIDKIFYRHNLENRLRDFMYLSEIVFDKFYSPVGAYTFNLILENDNNSVYPLLDDLFYSASIAWEQNKFFVQDVAAVFNYIAEWVLHLDTYVLEIQRLLLATLHGIEGLILHVFFMTNALFQDIHRQVNNLIEELEAQFAEALSVVQELLHQGMAFVSEAAQPVLEVMRAWMATAAVAAQEYAQNVATDLQGCWKHLVDFTSNLSEGLAKELPDRASVSAFFHVDEFTEGVTNFAEDVKDLVVYSYTMIEYGTSDMVSAIKTSEIAMFLGQLREVEIRSPDEWLSLARAEAEAMVSQLDAWFARKDRVSMIVLSRLTGLRPTKLAELWMEFKEGLRTLQRGAAKAVVYGTNVLDVYPNLPLMNEEIFALERGVLLNYVQYLPMSWNSFTQRPQSDLPEGLITIPTLERVQRIYDHTVKGLGTDLSVITYPESWLPPFIATASIVGQHVTTFDQHHFEFLGTCSYLLTRDFKRKSFDIIGHYTDDRGIIRLASVTMKTRGKTMELTVSGQLFVSGNPVELPYRFKNTHEVSTIGTGVHMAYNKKVVVSCWPATKACSVTVDGTFFGQLAGLLGSFNNEPSDDMKGPGGSDAYSVRHFSYLWAVNDQPCYSANYAMQIQYELPLPTDNCHKVFLSRESPLRSCFSSVPPVPYFWKCVNDRKMHSSDSGQEKKICAAAKAYSLQCFTQGIMVPQLQECKHCMTPSGKLVKVGQLERVETPRRASDQADIVVILETAKCNEGRNMEQFITALEKAMKKKGKTDVRFAFVTFNKDSKPTAATIGDDMFHTTDEMKNLVREIDYNFRASVDGREDAVRLAADFRWRPDAVRSVVLLACSSCQLSDPEEFQMVLEEKKITLHLIAKIRIEIEDLLNEKNKTTSGRILGFDNTFAYTVKDYSPFVGDEELHMSMKESEDICVDAALKSHGSVFSSYKWVPKKKVLVKKFLRILATKVSLDMIPAQCQMCRCREHFFSATALSCTQCQEEEEEPVEEDRPEPEQEEDQELVENIRQNYNETFGADVDFNKIFIHLRDFTKADLDKSRRL